MNARKLLSALLATVGMASAGAASAIVVGNVNFGSPGTSNLDTTTIAETLITATGQTLNGYGVVNTVNGAGGYCAVDANCRLFFTFTGYLSTAFSPTNVQFSSGVIHVYYDPGTGGANTGFTRNLLSFSSAANTAYINALAGWVQLDGHGNLGAPNAATTTLAATGTLTGNSISFNGSGLLDVDLGAFGLASVRTYLNGNGLTDALGNPVDIQINTSGSNAVLNPNDVCTAVAGQFCIQGSADLRGPTNIVPEPMPLVLLAAALFAVGFSRRRQRR